MDDWRCDGQSIPVYVEALEQRLLMAADPVAWALSAASPVQFTDSSGDLVTIKVAGTATGTVFTPAGGVNGFDGDAVLIDLINAGPDTRLKITTPRGTTTYVGDITVDGAMARLTAMTTTLTGTMTVDGALSHAAFAGLSGATIDVDGTLSKLTVTGSADSSTVRATGDLTTVRVGSATDSNFLAGILDGVDKPWMTRQFTGDSSVKSFSITDKTGVFTDSVVAAQTLGSIKLRNASGDNAAIVAEDAAVKEIKSLTSLNTGAATTAKARQFAIAGKTDTRHKTRYVEGSAFAVAVNLVSTDGSAPVANATTGLKADEGEIVALDASTSSDADGQTLSYLWTQIGGPMVTLDDITSATPTFTAPLVTIDTQLAFTVTVTDTDGMHDTMVPVVVTVNNTDVESTGSSSLQGDNGVFYVSQYSDTWVSVAAPSVALGGASYGYAPNPQGIPQPARNLSVQYACVDKYNRRGPWSNAVTFNNCADGQGVYFDMSDFVPNNVDIIGTVWLINGYLAQVQFSGVGPVQTHEPFPWAPVQPNTVMSLASGLNNYYDVVPQDSTILTTTPPDPVLYLNTVPNVDLDVAYCWVTDRGETALSPSVLSPASSLMDSTGKTYRTFTGYAIEPPVGAKGYHVYAKQHGTSTWYRMPAPECRGTPSSPDDYLFQLNMLQPRFYQWDTQYTHSAAQNPESLVSALQMAYNDTSRGDVVIVDVPEVDTGVPIILSYGSGASYGDVTIRGLEGQTWTLKQNLALQSGCTYQGSYFPMVLVNFQYGTVEGCQIQAPYNGSYPNDRCASMGFASSDWSGGQAFGVTLKRCTTGLRGDTKTIGLAVLDTSSSWWGNHTASEWVVEDCRFSAFQGIRLEGNQTANMQFNHCYSVSAASSRQRGSCAAYIDTPNTVFFNDGFYAEQGFAGFYLGNSADVRIQHIWVDGGYPVFFDCFGYTCNRVELDGGKLNTWNDFMGYKKPWLFLNPCGVTNTHLKLDSVNIQLNDNNSNGPFELGVLDNYYRGTIIDASGSDTMGSLLKVYTPTQSNWQNDALAWNWHLYGLGFGSYVGGNWVWNFPGPHQEYTNNLGDSQNIATQGWTP